MFIAIQKRKDNIAEYLLYMWHLEDIIRAYQFDFDKIKQNLIDPANYSKEKEEEASTWYKQIINMMINENVEVKGHLKINDDLLAELLDFHLKLLKDHNQLNYIETYYKVLPTIKEIQSKAIDKTTSDIETCFVALYGFLLLKMQKKNISKETTNSIKQISELLKELSRIYKATLKTNGN